MDFKQAVSTTPHLEQSWQVGLQALKKKDRARIESANTFDLKGSVDIDTSLKKCEPNASRWDYVIAYKHSNRNREHLYWVEIHPSGDSEINVVLNKLEWLKNWLDRQGKRLVVFQADFIWIPTSGTTFTRNAKQMKILAQKGLIYKGAGLKIPANRSD
ncbi:hypothetical protein GF406_22820 [candidate division KSB1 bacterium]|nr:hypothetical protein [candidate division KSB1 bacterium]